MGPRQLVADFFLTGIGLCLALASSPQAGKRLWVLHETGEMIEYDPSSWAALNRVAVPSQFVKDPDSLQINSKGQMLFCADPWTEFGDQDRHFSRDKVWLWNGQSSTVFDRSPGGAEDRRWWALSSQGRGLYVFENEFEIVRNAEGAEDSVRTEFQAWETDLKGTPRTRIAAFSFPRCQCTTGVCSESCPETGIWFQAGGVDDFFVATRWIPGQIGATYQSSFGYRRVGDKWLAEKLPHALEQVQDAAQSGSVLIHRVLDGGCCGWENAGDDQTILEHRGRSTVVFDERRRYANPDYDVSFFTVNAGISPDRRFVAVTIGSTSVPGSEIRLADGGKPDPVELTRIRDAIARLPAVEVIGIENSGRGPVTLPRAAFAGWLSDREILVVTGGTLAAFDIASGARRSSEVKAAGESFVFLR